MNKKLQEYIEVITTLETKELKVKYLEHILNRETQKAYYKAIKRMGSR